MRNFTTRIQNKANALALRARMALSNQRGDFYISDAVKIIIAVVLLAASVACFFQIVKDKDSADVSYNRNELMVMLGAAAIILCTSLIGLVPSCLIYILLWLKLVEHAPWKVIITIEIIMAAIILGVFTTWLQIRFPVGLLGSLLGL